MSEPVVALLQDAATESVLLRLNRQDLLARPETVPVVYTLEQWLQSQVPYLLRFHDDTLQLLPRDRKLQPLSVDLTGGSMAFRGQQNVRNEMVVKAVLGRDKQHLPRVIDATAGLGRDSFLLATLGCDVMMVERHPVVSALLQDGLRRYRESGDAAIAARLGFHRGNFVDQDFAEQSLAPAEVVYLDPMFPQREKSAKVKKEMQIFKHMVGADTDSDTLLNHAKTLATRRVVVKRPAKAPFLADTSPTYSLTGRSSRFDIYQTGPAHAG